MSTIKQDNSYTIGNTPLVKLNTLTKGLKATILAKIEGRNPMYSVKCRIGANMVWDAEKKGVLKSGMEIVEATSGNTGIALAGVAAARGYGCTLVMPDTMSVERRKLLKVLGARLILTDGTAGMKGAIAKTEELVAEDPDKYYLIKQFENPANPEIHYKTTGPEIWQDTGGQIDVLIAGVGTGGTLSGTSKFLKSKNHEIMSVAVEPANSPVISQTLNHKDLKPGPHKIQGIGAGFIPKNLDLSIVDRVETVVDEDAMEHARSLATDEGILAGMSCGAAVAAAIRLAQLPEFETKTIVAILPDSGERYLSTGLYNGIIN